ncbi:hypothetical protein GCM10023208_32910 [Erythrobacter westpacificensis]|jgi:hypothetical protein
MSIRHRPGYKLLMQLDDLLQRYFATTDLSGVSPDTFAAGIEHCRVDLGLEEDRGKRFALWSFLHMFGSAPDLDVAFENEEDRQAARNFMDLLAASEGDG